MFIHKYKPLSLDKIKYNPNIINKFKLMSNVKYINNMILYGPPGSGKKTILMAYLKEIYGDDVHILKSANININKNQDIKYLYSKYHIEIDLDLYKSSEKNIIFEFIKSYSSTKNIITNDPKIIIFLNSEKIPEIYFCMLRRIIELYSNTARYIFLCKNISKIPKPILSRLFAIRIRSINNIEIMKILSDIAHKENIKTRSYNKIIINSYDINNINNIHKIINLFQLSFIDNKFKLYINHHHEIFNEIIDIINNKINNKTFNKINSYNKIRNIINNKYIENYPIINIIKYILNNILNNNNIDQDKKIYIINYTSKIEHKMKIGNKPTIYLELFIYFLFNIL